MIGSALNVLRDEFGALIDDEVAAWLDGKPPHLGEYYRMMRYQAGLVDERGTPGTRDEDSRLAALLCPVACRAVGGNPRDALRAAAAIELLSGWIQIHRDIETNAATSRGRPALWTLWGDRQSINAGDGMYPLAGHAMLLAVDDPQTSLLLTRELTDTAMQVMEGQHLGLTITDRQDVTAEERVQAIQQTAGGLTGYSCWAGAVIGKAPEELQQALRTFGSELGTARSLRHEVAIGSALDYLNRALDALRRANLDRAHREALQNLAQDLMLP